MAIVTFSAEVQGKEEFGTRLSRGLSGSGDTGGNGIGRGGMFDIGEGGG